MKLIKCVKNDKNNNDIITIGKIYELIRYGDSDTACVIKADGDNVWKISKFCFEDLDTIRDKKIEDILS